MPAIPGTLTGELARRQTPLREWFAQQLPHCDAVYNAFRRSVMRDCIEPPKGISSGTLGAALDYLIRYMLEPTYDAALAVLGAHYAQQESRLYGEATKIDWLSIVEAAIRFLQENAHRLAASRCTGPELLIALVRRCWVLALFTELVRGVPLDRSQLGCLVVDASARASADLAEIMPAEVDADIEALYVHVRTILMPFIAARTRPGVDVLGPSLGFHNLAADADLIVGATLIEIKAVVGRRSRDGIPRYGLDARLLYQVVSYALLSIISGHRIDEVAIFNARYGHLYRWSLKSLLSELAGRPMPAEVAARKFRSFIEASY